jgi:hypothetical protein
VGPNAATGYGGRSVEKDGVGGVHFEWLTKDAYQVTVKLYGKIKVLF